MARARNRGGADCPTRAWRMPQGSRLEPLKCVVSAGWSMLFPTRWLSVADHGGGAHGVPRLPQQDLPLVVARGEGLAIRRESNGIDPGRMSQKGVELLPGDRVPESHLLIVASRGNRLEIR